MKIKITFLVVILFLFSCQKEVTNSIAVSQRLDSTVVKPKLLTELQVIDSTDTSSIHFSYDNNNKLIDIESFQKVKLYSGNYIKIVRDDSGFIIGYLKDEATSDSLYDILYHDPVSKKYTYKIEYNSADILRIDSIAYSYTGSNITSYTEYQTDQVTGFYKPVYKRDFIYNQNNNVTIDQSYDFNPATQSLFPEIKETYTYDQKKNPLNLGVESIIFDFVEYSASNNVITVTTEGIRSDINLITYKYTYNSNNEPETYTSVASPPGYISKAQYIYQ